MTIELTADAHYGEAGKQFIARIIGRHPKYTFERQFLGRKGGKRGERSYALIDEPGLYTTRCAARRGYEDRFWLIADIGGELQCTEIDEAKAMELAAGATRRKAQEWAHLATLHRIAMLERKPASEATAQEIARLRASLAAGDDRAASIERVRALMAELGVTIDDLVEASR